MIVFSLIIIVIGQLMVHIPAVLKKIKGHNTETEYTIIGAGVCITIIGIIVLVISYIVSKL